MAALPSLPFKVGIDVYNWAENKVGNMDYPLVKQISRRAMKFCKDHPFIGACALLTGITTLGPMTLLIGFLLFTNTCLLIGFAVIEFFIVGIALSFFIPVFLVASAFSVTATSCFAVVSHIWSGSKQKGEKTRKSQKPVSNLMAENITSLPTKKEEFDNKMTQTTDWVEKTGWEAEEINDLQGGIFQTKCVNDAVIVEGQNADEESVPNSED